MNYKILLLAIPLAGIFHSAQTGRNTNRGNERSISSRIGLEVRRKRILDSIMMPIQNFFQIADERQFYYKSRQISKDEIKDSFRKAMAYLDNFNRRSGAVVVRQNLTEYFIESSSLNLNDPIVSGKVSDKMGMDECESM